MDRLLRGGPWVTAAAVAAYVVLGVIALFWLAWSGVTSPQRGALRDISTSQLAGVLASGALLLTGLVLLVGRLLGRYVSAVRRLAAETRLLVEANPAHRVSRRELTELSELAGAVDALAERRRIAEVEVAAQVDAAQAGLEEERNRLATLMAELAVAVLVCNVDGRILLYNAAARTLLDDDTAVGLGRSVFGIVGRDLLEHALARIRDTSSSHVATTLHGGRMLQVRVATVGGGDEQVNGFVLLFEDLTERVRVSSRRDEVLREFTEATRSSLGSIQAAIESVIDYPHMAVEERAQFVAIIREEALRLGSQVEVWAAEATSSIGAEWLLGEVGGEDLLSVVAEAVNRVEAVTAFVRPSSEALWVKADSHALAQTACHLVTRLHEHVGLESVTLGLSLDPWTIRR